MGNSDHDTTRTYTAGLHTYTAALHTRIQQESFPASLSHLDVAEDTDRSTWRAVWVLGVVGNEH